MIKFLKQKHKGYAITFEVICTLLMFITFITMTLYVLRVMNVQRFMNTVMTSAAAQASRWGGNYTKAYAINVGKDPIQAIAQEQLNTIAGDFRPEIVISPEKITSNNDTITVVISYRLPPIFRTMSKINLPEASYDMYDKTKEMKMSLTVRSIMRPGPLL